MYYIYLHVINEFFNKHKVFTISYTYIYLFLYKQTYSMNKIFYIHTHDFANFIYSTILHDFKYNVAVFYFLFHKEHKLKITLDIM